MPSGAKRFNVEITSTDKSLAGFKSAEKRFQTLGKGAMDSLNKGLESFAPKGLKSFSKGLDLGKGISTGKSISELVGGFAEAAEGATLLERAVGGLTLGLGGLVGVAVTAGIAAYKFSAPWINAGANLANLSKTLGIATKDLQDFENAGAQFGVDKGAMDSSLAGIAAFAHADAEIMGGSCHRQR